MTYFLRLLLSFAAFVGVSYGLSRWSSEALIAGISVMMVLAIIGPRRRAAAFDSFDDDNDDDGDGRPWFGQIVAGLLIASGGILTAELAVRMPTWNVSWAWWTDRDRQQVEAQLDQLERQANWQDASDVITARLQRSASNGWMQTLRQRQFQDEIHESVWSDEILPKLNVLLDQCQHEGRDDRLVRQLIDGLAAEGQLPKLRQLLAEQSTQSVQREQELAEAYIQSLLKAADQVARSPRRSRRWLEAAAAVSERYHVEDDELLSRLRSWKAPDSLSADVQVSLRGVTRRGLTTLLDLEITRPNGQAVEGLNVRNWEITRGGRPVDAFTVEPERVIGDQLRLAIVIDGSTSTQGPPIQQAISGATRLAESIDGFGEQRAWRFANDIKPLTGWTRHASEIRSQLSGVRADGTTALLRAVEQVIADLARQLGRRVIVIFSDGKDTVGGLPAEQLIARCRQHDITIYAVALQTADVDLPLLKTLSESSGGRLLVAADVGQIVAVFADLIEELHRPVYRLTVLADEMTNDPIEIQIGRDPGKRITAKTPTIPAKLTKLRTARPHE